jgi:hypothetical protein
MGNQSSFLINYHRVANMKILDEVNLQVNYIDGKSDFFDCKSPQKAQKEIDKLMDFCTGGY